MKSAILIESKKPLEVADVDLPDKLEFGQVLVKVFYSGLCGAQLNEIDATKGTDKFLPHLLGHEGSGIVEKTGEGVIGVSFKMKGPPKDIKTTVNPIKTLTPRFIVRALEKMKKKKKEESK